MASGGPLCPQVPAGTAVSAWQSKRGSAATRGFDFKKNIEILFTNFTTIHVTILTEVKLIPNKIITFQHVPFLKWEARMQT